MKIDFSQMQTKEARAAEEVAEREDLAREECARRINAQISAVGQVNIAADFALGLLDEAGMAAFRSWRV